MKSKIAIAMLLAALSTSANADLITIGSFTGGDQGEGLDLTGKFDYAVNIFGAGGLQIGDALFTDDSISGFTINAENEYLLWKDINSYGDSINDNNLETVMHSIRWSRSSTEPNSPRYDELSTTPDNDVLTMDMQNLEIGNEYSLQLLFAEKCCNRGFDIYSGEKLLADNFAPYEVQGMKTYDSETHNLEDEDITLTTGAFLRYDFIAQDTNLNISLGGISQNNSDNNPLIQGLTLENKSFDSKEASIAVSEPASALILLPFAAFALRRRNKSK